MAKEAIMNYYRYHHQGDTHHNRITCTDCLPDVAKTEVAQNPRRRTIKIASRSWHKLPPAYLAELFRHDTNRIICDHCRNDGQVTIS
jgi:hypothetical protein